MTDAGAAQSTMTDAGKATRDSAISASANVAPALVAAPSRVSLEREISGMRFDALAFEVVVLNDLDVRRALF